MKNVFCFTRVCRENLGAAITLTRKIYQRATDADLHICLSHRRRRVISCRKQAHFAKRKAYVKIPAFNDPSYQCCVGTKIIGSTTQGRIVNGGRYEVPSISENIRLKNILTEEEFTLTTAAIGQFTQLGWACVYQKVQGQTCEGTILLHDLNSCFASLTHLYVGLSRATSGANVFVE